MFYEYEDYELKMDSVNEFINDQIKSGKKFKEIELNELKLNDLVIVKFYPRSQKYLYDLYPRYGYVTNINKEYLELTYEDNNENIFLYCQSYDYSIEIVI
jgi:hypothetical protein